MNFSLKAFKLCCFVFKFRFTTLVTFLTKTANSCRARGRCDFFSLSLEAIKSWSFFVNASNWFRKKVVARVVSHLGNRVFRTNVFSYHLDTRSYHIVYMFVPHKHTFEIAQRASPNLSYLTVSWKTRIEDRRSRIEDRGSGIYYLVFLFRSNVIWEVHGVTG